MVNVAKNSKRIELSDLIFDGNPRTGVSLKLDQMISSFLVHGYQPDSAIMVEEREDGRIVVLRGNRRALAALELSNRDTEGFNRVFSDGKIPAIIVKGLSDQERILYRIDHSSELNREPLDDEGFFNAVCQLLRAGLNQKAIAKHLNLFTKNKKTGDLEPNRSLVQWRAGLAKLPSKCIEEYRILMRKGPEATSVRWSMVAGLFKLYNKSSVEYPDGTVAFNELWEKCLTPKEEQTGSLTQSLTPKKAKDFSQYAQSVGTGNILLQVTGQTPLTFEDIDLAILAGEQAIATLNSIHDYLGKEDYNNLISESLKGESEPAEADAEAVADAVADAVDADAVTG